VRRSTVLAGVVLLAAAGGVALARRKPTLETHAGDLTGAPFPLRSDPRAGPIGEARVVPPRWEPRAITALGSWEPQAPTTRWGRLLAYLWAAPLSAGGLLLGLSSGSRPTVREGVVVFANAGGFAGAVLRKRRFAAAALGHVVIAAREPSAAIFAHELVHVRQAERLGPLLGPLYLKLLVVYGYARHPLERAPRAAARRVRVSEGRA
jgi:hypothetical protein